MGIGLDSEILGIKLLIEYRIERERSVLLTCYYSCGICMKCVTHLNKLAKKDKKVDRVYHVLAVIILLK